MDETLEFQVLVNVLLSCSCPFNFPLSPALFEGVWKLRGVTPENFGFYAAFHWVVLHHIAMLYITFSLT